MKFQIGQTFIEVNFLRNMKGFTFRLIAPIGESNMVKVGLTVESNENQPLIGNIEIYKRGDSDAEESTKN